MKKIVTNQKGFTMVEVFITVTIVGVLIGFGVMVFSVGKTMLDGNANVSLGINGLTESRCIEGYKFILDQDGRSRQILNEFGKGVACDNDQK